MAVKERKQITGTTAQINAYEGHEGQIVWDKEKKTFVGMSGTAGKNYPLAPQSYVDNEIKKIYDEVASNIPVGMVAMFHTPQPPEGWLLCNGAAVSRTTYADLFSVIGTTHGSGDGSTTFNLPSLHHRFLEATTTSSEVGTSVSAGLPNITGGVGGIIWVYDSRRGAFMPGSVQISNINRNVTNGGKETVSWVDFSAALDNGLYGASGTVQPASLRLLACIKF